MTHQGTRKAEHPALVVVVLLRFDGRLLLPLYMQLSELDGGRHGLFSLSTFIEGKKGKMCFILVVHESVYYHY